jgi:hypothetical protein
MKPGMLTLTVVVPGVVGTRNRGTGEDELGRMGSEQTVSPPWQCSEEKCATAPLLLVSVAVKLAPGRIGIGANPMANARLGTPT